MDRRRDVKLELFLLKIFVQVKSGLRQKIAVHVSAAEMAAVLAAVSCVDGQFFCSFACQNPDSEKSNIE